MAEQESQHKATQGAGPNGDRRLQPAQLKQRIDALPATDMAGRMDGLTSLLDEINRTPLTLTRQQELLDLVDPEITDAISGYQAQARHWMHPLTKGDHALYTGLQALLTQASLAYKRLALDLLGSGRGEPALDRLRHTIIQCMDYLTQRALHAYAVYQEAPADIWSDLHRIYAFAEKKQLATDVVEHLSDLSVSGVYARALLLSLATPGHLLQGEIYRAYEKLAKWGLAVRLEHPAELPEAPLAELLEGRYFCDLAAAAPPAYGSGDVDPLPKDARLINLDEVLNIINARMKELALELRRSLVLRSEWDLLLRLRRAWEKRPLRQQPRKAEHGVTVKAIVSLSSCHAFYTGYQTFEPEKSEIHLHGDSFQQPASLSLVSLDATPWLDADTETKLETGVIKPRTYNFDIENRENDVWKKSHLLACQGETRIEKVVEEHLLETIYEFRLVNTSAGGEGLETLPDSTVHLRVGELLALFPHGDEADGEPSLNIVRWIQSAPDLTLRIGVRRIDGAPEPLAVRALGDKAIYREYVRAFVLEEAQHPSIIVPAGQFECHTTLVVNDDESLRLLKLDNLIESTRAFARFRFTPLDIGESRREEIVASLKALLRQNIE